jgi:ERCC4-related helicase
LAPTVALCLQQHRAISQHIPAAKSRTLTGLDKVELWTEQVVWDAVLNDIQVVVSTPAVLLDAMTHGFVRISRLGLIIFDEGPYKFDGQKMGHFLLTHISAPLHSEPPSK